MVRKDTGLTSRSGLIRHCGLACRQAGEEPKAFGYIAVSRPKQPACRQADPRRSMHEARKLQEAIEATRLPDNHLHHYDKILALYSGIATAAPWLGSASQ